MQTLERTKAVQYTINISQDVGTYPEASNFLSNALESLLVLLEQKGQPIEPLLTQKLTPELLESLLVKKETEDFTPAQLASINRGRADVRAGRTTSDEDMQAFFDECERDLQLAADQRR